MDLTTFRARYNRRPTSTLDACGVPVLDPDAKFVELPLTILYSRQLTPNQILPDERVQVPSVGDFYCCAISGDDDLNIRILWPDGRYSSNALQPSANMYGLGADRHCEEPARLCPGGSYIGIEAQNPTAANAAAVIAFEGYVKVYFR